MSSLTSPWPRMPDSPVGRERDRGDQGGPEHATSAPTRDRAEPRSRPRTRTQTETAIATARGDRGA